MDTKSEYLGKFTFKISSTQITEVIAKVAETTPARVDWKQ